MDKSIKAFRKPGSGVKYSISEFAKVIHLQHTAFDKITFCGITSVYVLKREDAWNSTLPLCNGCFQ